MSDLAFRNNIHFGRDLQNLDLLDRVVALQEEQHRRTPYHKVDPSKYLFGGYADLIKDLFAVEGKHAGEVGEFYEQALKPEGEKDTDKIKDEFSDFLIQLINLGYKMGINVKEALEHGLKKRLERLRKMVILANKEEQKINKNMDEDRWNDLWDRAKGIIANDGMQMELPFEKHDGDQ